MMRGGGAKTTGRTRRGLGALAALALLMPGCSMAPPPGVTPDGQESTWVPPAEDVPGPPEQELAPAAAASDNTPPVGPVSLTSLLDLALRANPQTRISWLRTQSAHAAVGMERAAYYPTLDSGAQATRTHRVSVFNGQPGTATEGLSGVRVNQQTNKGPYLALNYVLFDFGARGARVDELKQALIASNFEHNAAVQNVVLTVQRAYYQYVSLTFLAETQQATLSEARANLQAAEGRRSAGVATIADVLQAKTAVARAELTLLSTNGRIQAVRGSVLTAVGLSPASQLDVQSASLGGVQPADVAENVESLLKAANAQNPTLAAARARAEGAIHRVDAVRLSGFPTFRANARVDEFYREGGPQEDYTTGVTMSFPLFNGFSYSYELEKAKRDADIAAAEATRTSQDRALAIWNDYFANKTAAEQMKTAGVLLDAAEQSHDVASSRYKEGVGSILDLLSAQSALEQARASQVQARADWLLSLAQLRFDVGGLDLPSDIPLIPETNP